MSTVSAVAIRGAWRWRARGADARTAPHASTDRQRRTRRSTRCTASASSTLRREDRDGVERAARRHHAARGDAAERRLQADDVAEGRRDAAGPGGVGAEREADDAGRDRAGRAGGRAARHVARRRTRCAARRTGCACRRGRWRTGRGWSCRSAARLHPAGAAPQVRSPSRCRQSQGRPRWWAFRRCRCCPSPRTARPRTCGLCGPSVFERRARARISSSGRRVIQIAGSSCARSAASAPSAASTASRRLASAVTLASFRRFFRHDLGHRHFGRGGIAAEPDAHQRDQQIAERHRAPNWRTASEVPLMKPKNASTAAASA